MVHDSLFVTNVGDFAPFFRSSFFFFLSGVAGGTRAALGCPCLRCAFVASGWCYFKHFGGSGGREGRGWVANAYVVFFVQNRDALLW